MGLFDNIKTSVQAGQGYAGMIKIDPTALKTLGENMTSWHKDQIPFATALALTRTAQRVKKAEIDWMQNGIDGGATPWTLKSLYLKSAQKSNPQARVWFKDKVAKGTAAGDYLKPQVFGGTRDAKPGEKAIRSRHKLAGGRYLIPGRLTAKDAHGNIRGARPAFKRIIASLESGGESKKGYFMGTPKGRKGPSGVWERRSKKLRLYAIETGEPQYTAKFDFFEISEQTVAKYYDKEFTDALNHAIKTAIVK